MEVDNARVGMPGGHQPLDASVVQRCADPEQAPELVVGADVVSRKDMQPAEAAEQHILRGPAADTAQAGQTVGGGGIVKPFQALQVQIAVDDRPGDLDDRARLGRAEAVALEIVRLRGCKRLGVGERARAVRVIGHRPPTVGVSRLSRWMPTASDSCWHAMPLTIASKTAGKRGGLSPR